MEILFSLYDKCKSRAAGNAIRRALIFRPFARRSFTRQMESQMAMVVAAHHAKTTGSNIY